MRRWVDGAVVGCEVVDVDPWCFFRTVILLCSTVKISFQPRNREMAGNIHEYNGVLVPHIFNPPFSHSHPLYIILTETPKVSNLTPSPRNLAVAQANGCKNSDSHPPNRSTATGRLIRGEMQSTPKPKLGCDS